MKIAIIHEDQEGKQVKQMKVKTLPQKTIGNEDKEQQKHSHEWGTCEPRKIQGYECSILEFKKASWLIPRDLKCNICHAVSALTTSKWDHTGDSFGFWNLGLEAKQLPVKRLWHGCVCLPTNLRFKAATSTVNAAAKFHKFEWQLCFGAIGSRCTWIWAVQMQAPRGLTLNGGTGGLNSKWKQKMETTSWQTPRTPTCFVDLRCIFDL